MSSTVRDSSYTEAKGGVCLLVLFVHAQPFVHIAEDAALISKSFAV